MFDQIYVKYMVKMDQYYNKTIFLWNFNAKLAKNKSKNWFFNEEILNYLDGLASWHVAISQG